MARYTVTPDNNGGYTVQKYGCLSRLFTWGLLLILVGFSIEYWYVTLPVLLLIGTGLILYARAKRR